MFVGSYVTQTIEPHLNEYCANHYKTTHGCHMRRSAVAQLGSGCASGTDVCLYSLRLQ